MDELLIIHYLGVVSETRSPQLKSFGIVSETRSPQLKSFGIISETRSPQLKSTGIAIEKETEPAMITYQINYK
jgi:hypothetical protein